MATERKSAGSETLESADASASQEPRPRWTKPRLERVRLEETKSNYSLPGSQDIGSFYIS